MRALAFLALIAWQTGTAQPPPDGQNPPVAQPQYLRYQRALALPAAAAGQACAVLPAGVFPDAAPSLRDLRIFPQPSGPTPHEIPYVITLSQTATDDTQSAHPVNLGRLPGNRIAFDLPMPPRPYSDIRLDISRHDFLASAAVSGSSEPNAPPAQRTALGTFTLFDLTSQHLSRNTTLPLAEATFPWLHVELTIAPAPGAPRPAPAFTPADVQGAQIPPSRLAQTLYSAVAETRTLTTTGRETRATLDVPARVPVERVLIQLDPAYKGNFSRDVRITAAPEPENSHPAGHAATAAQRLASGDDLRHGPLPAETLTGSILRVHSTVAGREISTEQLATPAVLGANLQSPARIEVTLQNGDDRPLPVAAIQLQMRQRKLCFEAPADPEPAAAPAQSPASLALFYGDPALQAPVYEYQRLFHPSATALTATLGPELPNPGYRPRPAAPKSFTEQHPEALWIALIAVICILGMVALGSARRVGAPHS